MTQLEQLLTAVLPAMAGPFGQLGLTVARFLGLVLTAPLISSPAVPYKTRLAIGVVLGVCCGLATADTQTPSLSLAGTGLVWLVLVEMALGAAIGFGAKLLLSGLELAGGLIDQQAGLTGAGTSSWDGNQDTAASGGGLIVLGGLLWLLLAPVGGDLKLIAALLDSLRALPPGTVTDWQSPVLVVRGMLSAACLLGLQVAAPVVLSLGLLQLVWGLLARSRGGAWQPPLSPLRILLTLFLLTATVTDLGVALTARVDGWLQFTAQAWTAAAEPVHE